MAEFNLKPYPHVVARFLQLITIREAFIQLESRKNDDSNTPCFSFSSIVCVVSNQMLSYLVTIFICYCCTVYPE